MKCTSSIILCCLWHRLSLPFYGTFARIVFLSKMIFFNEIMDWLFKNIPVGIGGGGRGSQMGKSTYTMGSRSKLTCTYDGEEGSNSFHFGAHVLIE